jgi:hypothetical protein
MRATKEAHKTFMSTMTPSFENTRVKSIPAIAVPGVLSLDNSA